MATAHLWIGGGAGADAGGGAGGAGGGGGDACFALITSWSGRGRVDSCCALTALAGAGGGSGNCAIGGGGAALVLLGIRVGPLMRRLALRVRGAGGCWWR
jgi:hypothetical protein